MLATMKCPSCGRDVPVSEALYCPFCGQTLRRVFSDGSASAPNAAPAPITAGAPNAASATGEPAQGQPPASWTPYPEQAAFQTSPAPEQPALRTTAAATPIRNRAVMMSALAVMVVSGLLIFERLRVAVALLRFQSSGYYLRYPLETLLLYASLALIAAYWLGWLRLAHRRASHVTLEAVVLGILILLSEDVLVVLALKLFGPAYYHSANPFAWWSLLTHRLGIFVWIILLATATGALGVGLANSCARWPLVRQTARRATAAKDFFTVFATCGLLLIAAAVIIVRAHIYSIFTANVVIVASLVLATLLAVRSGKRRLAKA